MNDQMQKLQQLQVGALVLVYWVVVAAIPFMLLGIVHKPDAPAVLLFSLVAAYFGFTGYRAWKRGWKSRFLLRVVVPAAVLFLASITAAVIAWQSDVPL